MTGEDLSKYKRKYHTIRHHAWVGLIFLSVVLVIRLIFLGTADILTPIIVILSIYVIIALIFTYRYSAGLSAEDTEVKEKPSVETEKEKIKQEVEKEQLKVENEKTKSEAKVLKKTKK